MVASLLSVGYNGMGRTLTVVRQLRRLLTGKRIAWFIAAAFFLYALSVINSTIEPGQPVKGLITGFQLTGHNERVALVQPPSGPILWVKGISGEAGEKIDCIRYEKRFWPNPSYECK